MKAARLLRYARRRAGLSQRLLAERSGIAQPTIARIERGHVSPRVDTLESLVRACGSGLEVQPLQGQGVDRTTIRELLRLSPAERLQLAAKEARNLAALEDRLRL